MDAVATRGFSKIVEDKTQKEIELENGLTYKGNIEKILGNGTFQRRIIFHHK